MKGSCFFSRSELGWKTCSLLAAILFLAFVLRLCIAFACSLPPAGDGVDFQHLAVSLLGGHGYALNSHPTAYRAPLQPVFLCAVYAIFGVHFQAAWVAQSLIGTLWCFALFLVGLHVCGKNVGLGAALLGAVCPASIYYSSYLWAHSENLSALTLTLSVWASLQGFEKKGMKWSVGAGLLSALSVLARPFSALLPGFIAVWYFVKPEWRRLRLWAGYWILAGCMFALTLSPWIVRNAFAFHQFIPLTTSGGWIFWLGNHPADRGVGFSNWQAKDEVLWKAGIVNEKERNAFLVHENIRFIREHPVYWLRLTLDKVFWFLYPFDGKAYGLPTRYNWHFGIVACLALAGIAADLRKWRQWGLLALSVGYGLLTCLVFYGMPRFRFPVDGFLIVLAAMGWKSLVSRGKTGIVVLAGIVILNGVLALEAESVYGFLRSLLKMTYL